MTIRALRSLTLRQAVYAMSAAVLIGLAVSVLEFAWTTIRERGQLLDRVGEISALVRGPAAEAAWTTDRQLGERTLDGIMGIRVVGRSAIALDRGTILIERARQPGPETWLQRSVAQLLFADMPPVETTLPLPTGTGDGRSAGLLRIDLDPAAAAADFLAYLTTTLLAGVARNLLIGLAVAAILHRQLTRPLLQIGRAIARIRTTVPRGEPLPIPSGHDGDELGFVVSTLNRTLRTLGREQRDLQRMATRDALTGLANRTLVTDRMGHAIELACRTRHRLAVLHIDLDRFKQVNDSFGHPIGDRLLCVVADRLVDTVRRCDTVGRLAGDEFLVILERVQDAAEAAAVAERILAAVTRPAEIDGHRMPISASIGIALHPEDGTDPQTLMRMADAAMQAAKADGGGRFIFYTRDMTDRAMARLRLEASLRDAIAGRSFELVYQPKVGAADGRLTGFEALVRWRHDGTLVPPADFIPLAEETGLIVEIGAWVLDEACRTAARWARQHGDVPIAINVSARQLSDDGFARQVEEALRRNGTRPHLLEIEITETVIMKDVRQHLPTLNRLRALGVRIAVDDFGTGYSSLAYLQRLPFDCLKVDQSFVRNLSKSEQDAAIVTAVLRMAEGLGVSAVAEGVETEAEAQRLRELGCLRAQGYHYGKPQEIDAWLPPGMA